MRIVIEIDENQSSGTGQSGSPTAQISMGTASSSHSSALAPPTQGASSASSSSSGGNATDAGAGPSATGGVLTQMESNFPFMAMPSAMSAAAAETAASDASAGAAPGESTESYSAAETAPENGESEE